MGSTHFLSSSPSPYSLYHLFLNPAKIFQNPSFSSNFLCSSSRRNWGSNFDASQSRRFIFEDELGRREKRRNWWSVDDDEDEEDDDDDDMGFGFWDESSTSTATDWFFKILRAFGWMVPAVMLSSLLGTGSDSLIMALVLPLGQTALSLVVEKVWGDEPSSRPTSRPRPRRRSKSRPRYRPGRNPSRSRPTNGGYQSWNASTNTSRRSSSNYGGWDELDEQVASSNSFAEDKRQTVKVSQKEYSETGKLSRRISRDKPLFIRLLIAVFPFLGSWTRFLF